MFAQTIMTLLISATALGLAAPAVPHSPAAGMTNQEVGNGAIVTSPDTSAAWAENVTGGWWRPLSLKGCVLALGTLIGALVTMGPYSPIVGSIAGHAALLACT